MTLPSSGSLSISQIAAEFEVALPCVFPDAFYGKPGVPASGPLTLPDSFYGLSNARFEPNGGSLYDSGLASASVIITATPNATWTFTGGGLGGSVSRTSGSSGPSIVFSLSSPPGSYRRVEWTLQGVIGSLTRNFTITLEAGNL